MKKGKVYLVGAGPGDPGLFTIKGKKVLEEADAVVYDNLVNPFLLKYAKESAKLIYAGKIAGKHLMDQDSINKLLVELANRGLKVVRLKGGDPFVFGRGAEEAQFLAKNKVEFEVVPGVSSAISVPAYAGIPLTHRKYTSSITFITGHEDPSKSESKILWNKVAGSGTIVILMGVGRIKSIKERLLKEGLSSKTPFAIISNGTLPTQKVIQGKLEEIDTIAQKKQVKPPAIIVIGDVVKLRKEISWFEKKPLFGKKIIITRPKDQAYELMLPLMEKGAECILFPTVEIRPPEDWDIIDSTIKEIEQYDWIIFTSVNGVRHFLNRIKEKGKDLRILANVKICAIGPKTAKSLKNNFIIPDLMPKEYSSEGIIKEFLSEKIKDKKILLLRAYKSTELLPKRLKEMGAKVKEIAIYRNELPEIEEEKRDKIKEMLLKREINLITFTSPLTFYNFITLLDLKDAKEYLKDLDIACIGPVTAEAVIKAGIRVNIVPKNYTINHLIKAILTYYTKAVATT